MRASNTKHALSEKKNEFQTEIVKTGKRDVK